MKIAVMQPYFFPYLGYFQLAYCVDEFVFFDDVNFIKKGFIHRNNILLNKEKLQFSIPVVKVSQNRKINDHIYKGEYESFMKQIKSAYINAPYFENVFTLIEKVCGDEDSNVVNKNVLSIQTVFDYLEIPFKSSLSSALEIADDVRAQAKIIEICKRKGATHYINALGGRDLYEADIFLAQKVRLSFMQAQLPIYEQASTEFIGGLSIIDILMWCDKKTVKDMIKSGNFD